MPRFELNYMMMLTPFPQFPISATLEGWLSQAQVLSYSIFSIVTFYFFFFFLVHDCFQLKKKVTALVANELARTIYHRLFQFFIVKACVVSSTFFSMLGFCPQMQQYPLLSASQSYLLQPLLSRPYQCYLKMRLCRIVESEKLQLLVE